MSHETSSWTVSGVTCHLLTLTVIELVVLDHASTRSVPWPIEGKFFEQQPRIARRISTTTSGDPIPLTYQVVARHATSFEALSTLWWCMILVEHRCDSKSICLSKSSGRRRIAVWQLPQPSDYSDDSASLPGL